MVGDLRMINRTYNLEKVVPATAQYAEEIEGFEPEEWLSNDLNVALINSNDDVALFEHQNDLFNTVCGHYFFFSRGKEALKASKDFLKEIFSDKYNIEIITGLTPVEHKGALWMNRQLGFKEHGEVTTAIGPCKFVMMTKSEWKRKTYGE
jgi:hypothetical protein